MNAAAEKLLMMHDVNLTGGLICLVCQHGWFTTQTADACWLSAVYLYRPWHRSAKVFMTSCFFKLLCTCVLVLLLWHCKTFYDSFPFHTCTPSSSSSSGGDRGGDFTSASSLTENSLFLFESFLAALAPPSDSTFLLLQDTMERREREKKPKLEWAHQKKEKKKVSNHKIKPLFKVLPLLHVRALVCPQGNRHVWFTHLEIISVPQALAHRGLMWWKTAWRHRERGSKKERGWGGGQKERPKRREGGRERQADRKREGGGEQGLWEEGGGAEGPPGFFQSMAWKERGAGSVWELVCIHTTEVRGHSASFCLARSLAFLPLPNGRCLYDAGWVTPLSEPFISKVPKTMNSHKICGNPIQHPQKVVLSSTEPGGCWAEPSKLFYFSRYRDLVQQWRGHAEAGITLLTS